MLQELLERFPGGCGLPANRQLAAVQRFLSVNADLQRLRRSVGAGIAAFNPATATSLRGVFCVVSLPNAFVMDSRNILPDCALCSGTCTADAAATGLWLWPTFHKISESPSCSALLVL